MAADFPNNPVAGQQYTVNGVTFVYRVTAGRGEFVAQAARSSGGGGGIEYTNILPEVKVAGTSYFDHGRGELVTTFNDGDSLQYLAYPIMGYGAVGGSGGGGNFTFEQLGTTGSTFVNYDGLNKYSFKRLKAGTTNNIRLTDDGETISLDGLDIVAPTVAGASLIGIKTATTQPIKRLVAGTNVTLSETASTVTINATGSGGGITLSDSLTRINALTPVNNNMMVWTGAGVANVPTTASTRAMLGLDTVANTLPMFTGTSTATSIACTPFIVSLLAATGVPTALNQLGITQGSNSNGNWLRIASMGSGNIQICWHAIVCTGATTAHGAGFIGAETTWTYPQPFAAVPNIDPTIRDGVAAMVINGASGYGTSSATFRQLAFVASANAAVGLIAIGYY